LSFDACSGADQGRLRAGERRGKNDRQGFYNTPSPLENRPAMAHNECRDPTSGE